MVSQENPEEIPEWIMVDDIETFRRLCEVHCGNNEDMILAMLELRRKMKNRAAAMRSREKRLQLQQQQQQQQQNPEEIPEFQNLLL